MEGDAIADVVDGDIVTDDIVESNFVDLFGLESVVGEFPNVRHHNQDKAHASRRVTSRLWKAIPELWDVYMLMVRGKTSIMRMTKIRPLFAAQLADFIKNDGTLSASYISQMGLAMHRFDSASKPMVMGVLCLLPLCAQAQWIIDNKDGEMKANAIQWARWLTTRKLILFAFQTEAGLEAIHLTRSWESEGKFEASDYRGAAEKFLQTCHLLFDLGHAAKLGFGARMIKTLKDNKIGF